MDGNGALLSLNGLEELIDDVVRRSGSIEEVKVEMLDAVLGKFLLVILWLVQPHNESYTKLLENWNIVIGCERSILISDVKWS